MHDFNPVGLIFSRYMKMSERVKIDMKRCRLKRLLISIQGHQKENGNHKLIRV